jgi:uncharacterized membrane protein YphA (DoxX/SURF4 family)
VDVVAHLVEQPAALTFQNDILKSESFRPCHAPSLSGRLEISPVHRGRHHPSCPDLHDDHGLQCTPVGAAAPQNMIIMQIRTWDLARGGLGLPAGPRQNRRMTVALWALQVILALIFLGAGLTKLKDDRMTYAASRPPNTSFAEDLSDPLFKTIGVLELLGAIGLILPWALDILPVLTPLAALGFVIVMIGAIVLHGRRGERQGIIINLVILVAALIVAIGRGMQVF